MRQEGGPLGETSDVYPSLRDELVREYGDAVSEDVIERVAHHAVGRFDGAKVRDFVPVLAKRHALAHLRNDRSLAVGVWPAHRRQQVGSAWAPPTKPNLR